ncbi:MAG: hypothetical protein HQ523_08870 [Lentisphaerae bacterium]|nr:hypothetical protein [Lentisphaerota bacterium]
MRESFLKLLEGEPTRKVVWTADLNYWLDGQKHAGHGPSDRFTEEGYLNLCRELGCMPYYWYDKFWLAEPEYDGVEVVATREGLRQRRTWKTPIGQLWEENEFMPDSVSTGCTKYAVETHADLEVLLYILKHRRLKPAAISDYRERVALWARYDGLPILGMPRSPLPAFIHEWCGMDHAVYLLFDYPELVREILELMEDQERPVIDAVCRLAPPLIHFCDNLSSQNLTGFFDEFMAAPYQRRLATFHAAGIRCAVHLDGTVKGLLPRLANVGFDAIEALTPHPAGDATVEEMRALAGNRNVILWGGVPGVMFAPPYTWKDMAAHVKKLIAAWSGTPFVVGVADQVPPNGDISMVRKISDLLRNHE